MFGWFRRRPPATGLDGELLLGQMRKQNEEVFSLLRQHTDLIRSSQKAGFKATAETAVILSMLPQIMAHLATGAKPHPEAKRQIDLLLAVANKLVDAQVAETPGEAGGFYSETLRDLRDHVRIPTEGGHRFRRIADTDSDASRTVIPIDPGQP